jgi:hypothetical protein
MPIPVSQPEVGLDVGIAANKISTTACDGASKTGAMATLEPWLVPQLQTKEIESSRQKKIDHQG